ncbi:insulin-degrading enzyme-like [Cloeon dipterum]|uniref:insulin-degrading enzyme-like n=1 Tax=Cloeon dipterum TaxID=197152 RepID=UPI00322092B3
MVKIFKNITKSKEDKRDYRGLILDNELRVLLISDPKIDKASAALSVNIGELSDPQELSGLAHFLERVLFLGTKKYSDFLTEHDGDGISTTDMENTTYYFYVAHEHLTGALDIFSQFPLAPLLDETKAKQILDILLQINYDYEKLLRNDQWRLNQFERSISKKNHPYNKFNHGNWQTLENDPKKNKIDLWKEMLNFHSNYYSPNIMSLVILGKDSLDELQKKAENSFGKIENKSVSLPEWPGHSVGDEQLCKAILAVPIEDTHKLEINFPIADISRHYKGPYRYLSYLLNNKSSGSLLSALKRSRWATNLEATCKSVLRDIAYCFVEIYLTEMGLMNVHDVIDLFFQYINLLQETVNQNHELTIYRDCLKNSYLNFHYRENEDSARDYCMELAENLLTEKWSRVKYVIRDIPKEMLDNWDFADSNDELEFPQKNEFIPDSLDILRADDEKFYSISDC